MERKLQFNKTLFLFGLLILSFNVGLTQSITNLTLDADIANRASFTLTNGVGVNGNNVPRHFIASQPVMVYKYQLSFNPTGPFPDLNTFSITNPPIGDGTSQSYERNFFVPNAYAPGIYYLRVAGLLSGQFSRYSNIIPVELFYDVSIDDLSDTGYVRCQTPAVSYRLATVRNTGNLTQTYNLSLNPNIAPTEQNLAFEILSLEGTPISSTPQLSAGASFSFLVKIAAIQGTQPNKNNYTALIATAQSDTGISHSEVIHTWTYCGNGGTIPDNPAAPDLILSKSGPSEVVIGEPMTYTLSMLNNSTREAILPTITDSIPVNLDIVSIYKNPADTRNISIIFNVTSRALQVTYATNNQNKFVSGDPPIIIYINVIPNCYVTPEVINTAFASNGAGDSNGENNVSTVFTDMIFDTSNQVEWTGRVNVDWFDCANWNKGIVPNANINVSIPTAVASNPIIDSGSPLAPTNGTAEVRDITIMNNKSLVMINSILEVNGNWTNNGGTLIPGTGTVAFVGSNTNQTIFDLSEEPTYYNLTVNTSNNVKVLVTDGHGLFVNNQLNLSSGDLRLNGKAQLIQTHTGTNINPLGGSGRILRDQLGQLNKYNYNYWSPPVGTTNSTYTIDGVMKDGSDPDTPLNINWIAGLNGLPGSPITVSTRWLYRFQNADPLYANWSKISQNTILTPGLGYTMKGVDLGSGTQNYTFIGKPFSGNYIHVMGAGKQSLLGNPYPSALDAHKFLDDNVSSLNGVLMFWDHFVTTNSHVLASYEGGYALLTKTSANPAVSPSGQVSTKLPKRFIPVGQGFMVNTVNAGNIIFKNSQRAFVKEDEQFSYVPFGDVGENSLEQTHSYIKIHLGIVTPEDLHHPVVIGFMNDKASEAFDYGYDAKRYEFLPNQFYFVHPDADLLIQGVGYFDKNKKYPLGVIVKTPGVVTFKLNEVENLSASQSIYLYDNDRQIYHDLTKNNYSVNLNEGVHNSRFSLRFKNHNLENNQNAQVMLNSIVVYRQNDQIVISNPTEQLTILNARLYNALGQEVAFWNITNGRENHIQLPLSPLASGIYVVQVQTDNGQISKKINIR